MVNEAVLITETGLPIKMTVADGTGIEKGALLVLSDPLTAASQTIEDQAVAGIAAQEKIASDGKTTLAVWREGIFRVLGSGTITVGEAVKFDNQANTVGAASVNDENLLGIALETASDAETLLIELKPMTVNLA